MQIPLSDDEVQTITANIVHLTEQQRARRKMSKHARIQLEQDWAFDLDIVPPFGANIEINHARPIRNDSFNAKQKIAYAQRREIINRIDGGADPGELAKGFEVEREFIVWIRNRARV